MANGLFSTTLEIKHRNKSEGTMVYRIRSLTLIVSLVILMSTWTGCALFTTTDDHMPDIQPEELIPYDTPPMPIKGWAEIQKWLVYPSEYPAQGKVGKVLITAKIAVDGSILHPEVTKSLGPDYDDAALEALDHVKFKPAMAHGEPVAVWITIPVVFKQP